MFDKKAYMKAYMITYMKNYMRKYNNDIVHKQKYRERNKIRRENNKDKKKNYYTRYYFDNKQKYIINNRRRISKIIIVDDNTINQKVVNNLLEQQEHKCKICGCDLRKVIMHLDHIIPISKWGIHSITNVQRLCKTCNLKKSDKII